MSNFNITNPVAVRCAASTTYSLDPVWRVATQRVSGAVQPIWASAHAANDCEAGGSRGYGAQAPAPRGAVGSSLV
eukprot:2340510-Prymnesium_polylepis.1